MPVNSSTLNGITTATISRPDSMNALNLETIDALHSLVKDFVKNDVNKALILTGDGEKAFVAGADIKELSKLNRGEAKALAKKGQDIFKMFEDCPKPVIAAVNGFALGGGCELAMACHMRIATENAKFGQPEVNLGILPGYGGTQRLTQLVGRGKALELMLTGDLISAQEAKSLGLVNHVVATKEELLALAEKIATKIIAKGPIAVAEVIKAVNAGFSHEQKGYEQEIESFGYCATTADFKEGTSAFMEKRPANFKGI